MSVDSRASSEIIVVVVVAAVIIITVIIIIMLIMLVPHSVRLDAIGGNSIAQASHQSRAP